ncbi:MAG TPA: hypothetical protein VMU62_07460 [Acidobacteriaceae bacterium]|nr:hypothetical protein [Acidobacteriaceae bacterium]
MQVVLYVAAVVSVCVLSGMVFFVMRSVREDEEELELEAETGLSFMHAAGRDVSPLPTWRETEELLGNAEREEAASMPVAEGIARHAVPLQPVFAQGFAPHQAGHPAGRGRKRSGSSAYAVVLQGMVVGAAIVLLTQTQRRLLQG